MLGKQQKAFKGKQIMSSNDKNNIVAWGVEKGSKASILFSLVIYGGMFLHLLAMISVIYNPNIMMLLELEPVVQYMIQLQPDGYNNLVQLKNREFADYFFHIHTASILFHLLYFSLMCIMVILINETSYGKPLDLNKIIKVSQKFRQTGVKFLDSPLWILFGFFLLCYMQWYLLTAAEQMEIKSRFSPNSWGIGKYVFLSSLNSLFIFAFNYFFFTFLRFNCWLKFKALFIGKQKLDIQIKHSINQQQYRED